MCFLVIKKSHFRNTKNENRKLQKREHMFSFLWQYNPLHLQQPFKKEIDTLSWFKRDLGTFMTLNAPRSTIISHPFQQK